MMVEWVKKKKLHKICCKIYRLIFCTKVFCSAARGSLITGEFHPKADCISAEVEMISVCQVVKSAKRYVIFQNESQYIKAIQFSFSFYGPLYILWWTVLK